MTHVLDVAARIARISMPVFSGDLPASGIPGSAKQRCTSPVDSGWHRAAGRSACQGPIMGSGSPGD